MNKQYPFNVTCIWVIEVGTTSTIDLYFQRFDDNNEDCSSSYLLMRDGMSSDANQLAKFCREKRPATTMRSNGNTLYIEYRAGINFQLYWRESVKEKEAGK